MKEDTPEIHQFSVSLSTLDGPKNETIGRVRIQYFSNHERAIRGIKYGGLCLLLAAGFILIPLLHFILVPLTALASPFVGVLFSRQKSVLVGGIGDCPVCSKGFLITKSIIPFPVTQTCKSCSGRVRVDFKV